MKQRTQATDNKHVTAAPPPTLPLASPAAAPVLSEEHLLQLAASRSAARKILRAVAVARFDGWTVAAFGALTVVFSLTDIPGLLLGSALLAAATVELRAAARLARFDDKAPRALGFNQLALACTLITYALWRIYRTTTGPSEYAALAASEPQLGQMLGPVEDLARTLTLSVYAALILVALVAQGGLALFYFARTRHVREYLAQTPGWVMAVQLAGQAP